MKQHARKLLKAAIITVACVTSTTLAIWAITDLTPSEDFAEPQVALLQVLLWASIVVNVTVNLSLVKEVLS